MNSAEIFEGGKIKTVNVDTNTSLAASLCMLLLERNINYSSLLSRIVNQVLTSTEAKYVSILTFNREEKKYTSIACDIDIHSTNYHDFIPEQECDLGRDVVFFSGDVKNDTRIKIKKNMGTLFTTPLKISDLHVGYLIICDAKYDKIARVFDLLDILALLVHKTTGKLDIEEKEDTTRDRFLATMSHELRTPLNGIVGMITILSEQTNFTDKQREYLDILSQCSSQLMSLMNNILDFSKMAEGKFSLLNNPLDIGNAVKTSVGMLEGRARAKKLSLNVSIQKNIPSLVGDQQRLIQILTNIIFNAIKFTENGSITLNVTAEKLQPQYAWKILFEVKDTGIGITPDMQEKIFHAFNQSPTLDTTISKNGTGLGLAISRELVRLMDGKITVKSSGIRGEGSTFSFFILVKEGCNYEEDDNFSRLPGAKILVVDDRQEMRLSMINILMSWKCIPTAVSSGEEALSYLNHGAKYDLAIVDICMPAMSGIELAQELRMKYKELPLIAVSSADTNQGVELFDVYLNKPVEPSILFPAVSHCLRKCGSLKNLKDSPRKRKKRSKRHIKILIAEDDRVNAYTTTELLCHLGYSRNNIKVVENGSLCIEEMKKRKYHVVLMDIVMPVMDGIQAAKEIKKMDNAPYIIVVSAAVNTSIKQQCQEALIDGVLIKPLLKNKLDAILSPLVKPSCGESKSPHGKGGKLSHGKGGKPSHTGGKSSRGGGE